MLVESFNVEAGQLLAGAHAGNFNFSSKLVSASLWHCNMA